MKWVTEIGDKNRRGESGAYTRRFRREDGGLEPQGSREMYSRGQVRDILKVESTALTG